MKLACISCSTTLELNDNQYFCPFCMTQVTCKQCNQPLLKGAIGCVSCGTRIFPSNENKLLNEIEFEQKGDTKKFKAVFTDTVGHDLVSTFGGMIGLPSSKRKPNFMSINKLPNISSFSNGIDDVEEVSDVDTEDVATALLTVFKIDGDRLILQTNNFKTNKITHKAIRVSLLTLLAYKILLNLEDLDRQKLTDILSRSKLNSANFRGWLSKSDEIITKAKNVIFLSVVGHEKAIEVLKEVVDPNITEGIIGFSKSSKSKRRKNVGEDGDSKDLRKSSKSPKEYVSKLLSDGYFKQKRGVGEIVEYLKDNHASVFQPTQISVVLGRLTNEQVLKRIKGEGNAYEYFV